MEDILIPALLGLLLMTIGFSNCKGHLSTIHWYHRRRVTDENKPVFGRLVGTGTMLAGGAVILYSGCTFLSKQTANEIWLAGGAALLLIGIAAGLGISLYAMIKYNKGIF